MFAAICSSLLVFQIQLVWKFFYRFCWKLFDSLMNFHLLFFQSERIPNPSEICFTLLMTFWSYMAIFGFCVLGELVTNRFDLFNETLCKTNWHLLPIELKRMLVIFMAITQKSVILGSGKTVICRLEAFKKVKIASTVEISWQKRSTL